MSSQDVTGNRSCSRNNAALGAGDGTETITHQRKQISSKHFDDDSSLLTKKSTSSRSLFSRVKDFFNFRKKKFKLNEERSNSNDEQQSSENREPKLIRSNHRYRSLPPKSKRTTTAEEIAQKSKDDIDLNQSGSTENKPSILVRIQRTFSFMYKRNPNGKLNRRLSTPTRKLRSTNDLKKSNERSTSRRNRTSSNPENFSSVSVRSRRSESRSKSPPIIPNGDVSAHHRRNFSPAKTEEIFTADDVDSSESKAPVASPEEEGGIEEEKEVQVGETGRLVNAKVVEDHHVKSGRRQHLACFGVDNIPGVAGIQNHGNTCFINAIIQCLSNTNPFAEYFALDYYRDDLLQNHHSLPLTGQKSKTLGRNHQQPQRGEVSEHLAQLLKSLWKGMYSSEFSLKFKTVVARHLSQYAGFEQHDAQEFLMELLNKIGEELSVQSNITSNSLVRKSHVPDKFGRKLSRETSDETAAVEHLAKCQPTNASSIIFVLFQWQHRAITVCHECGHSPKTFDPYLHIPLPVPARYKFTIFVQVLFRSRLVSDKMKKYGLSLEANATIRALRDKISRHTRIPEVCLLLLRPDQDKGMVEFSENSDMISNVFEDGATIQALETPPISSEISDTPQMCQQMLTIVWLNRVGIGCHGTIFGPFFTTLVSREISFLKLTQAILEEMSAYLSKGEHDLAKLSHTVNVRLRLVDGLGGKEYLEPDVDHPLFVKTVEHALAKIEKRQRDKYQGPYHLKLVVEWDLDVRQSILVTDEQFDIISGKRDMTVDESAKRAPDFSRSTNRASLYDCLDLFFQDENLTNSWQCSSCGSPQQCTRQLSIWSLPDILILHLKRFHSVSQARNAKIDTLIDYPLNGLDLLKYVQRKLDSNGGDVAGTKSLSASSSSKLTYQRLEGKLEETTYNLYAVCRHHGSMQRGHYTACCKNSLDNCWYLYDDTKVSPISEDEVVTADAYILFYQKSYVHTAYYHSVQRDHWCFKMAPFYAGSTHLNGTKTLSYPGKSGKNRDDYTNGNHFPAYGSTKSNNNNTNNNYHQMNGYSSYSSSSKKYQQQDYHHNSHYDENDHHHHNGTMNNGYHHHHSNNGLKSKYY